MVDRSVSIRVDANVSPFQRALLKAAASAKQFNKSLETSNDRTALLVQSAAALGPALAPIGAVAVPAVAGLTSALAAGAAVAISAGLAFSGMGDSLEKINAYRLEPTMENFVAMRDTLAEMSPAGQDFARFIADLNPELERLQAAAQSGMFPGMEDGLTSLLDQMPVFEKNVGLISEAVGQLSSDAGNALTGPFWDQFFEFFGNAAATDTITFGRAIGNFTEGLAAMFQAFHPLSDDFTSGLLDMSEAFSTWAKGLGDNSDFQAFVAYIRDVMPQVKETAAALFDAILQIAEAAGEVGPHVLQVIELIADGIGALADSPMGPAAIGLLAFVAALSRLIALGKTIGGGGLAGTFLGGFGRELKALPGGLATTGSAFVSFGTDMKTAGKHAANFDTRMKTVRQTMGTMGKLGAIGGLAALSTTGLPEQLGMSNAAMGAMVGTIGGPWGAAVGLATGMVFDLAAANDDMTNAIDGANSALSDSPSAFADQAAALKEAGEQVDSFKESMDFGWKDAAKGFVSPITLSDDLKNAVEGWFGDDDVEEGEAALEELEARFERSRQAVSDLNVELGGADIPLDDYSALEGTVTDLAPAFAAAGIDINQWLEAVSGGGLGAIIAMGQFEAAKDEIAGFGNQMDNTADSARNLDEALDDLMGGKLGVEEAFLNYKQSLKDLNDELRQGKKTLNANTQAGIDNRTALKDSVAATIAYAKAVDEAGGKQSRVNGILRRGFGDIMAVADAAGWGKDQVRDYLKVLGLTPENIRTVMRLFGADEAKGDVYDVNQGLDEVDGKHAKPSVSVVGAGIAIGALDGVAAAVAGIDTSVTISVGTAMSTGARGLLAQADGGVVEYYGNGGVRENHVAQIAPAGAWRVWAEPETGGEAYIPLAASKRSRSRDIATETVGRLGGQVSWFADGALVGSRAMPRLEIPDAAIQVALGELMLSGRFRIDNWQDGEGQMRLVAEDVVDGNRAFEGSRSRMNRRR